MSSQVRSQEIVADYLSRLERALAGAPRARREEILADVRAHIEEASAGLTGEAELLSMLDRLGEPAGVAEAALEGEPAPVPRRAGLLEVLALVLTPVFWPAGVILLWTSSGWNVRDKLIGTLLPPGGYIGVLFGFPLIFLRIAYTCGGGSTTINGVTTGFSNCPPPPPGWVSGLYYASTLLWFLLPVLSGVYLGLRLRRR